MVKIIGRTLKEKNLEKKIKKLVDIASVLDMSPSIKSNSLIALSNGRINVMPVQNLIIVDSPNYFDKAVVLARTYEQDDREWTIKKDYD